MSDIDQQFIEYVVKSLVGKPDAVHIDRRIDEKGVLLELTVDPEDLGRVIGKRGATAQSLRTLLRALGTKNDARYNLKIIDNGEPRERQSDETAAAPVSSDSGTDHAAASDANDDVSDHTDHSPQIVAEVSKPAASVKPSTAEEPAPTKEAQTSDRMAQARAELADLDDLDI